MLEGNLDLLVRFMKCNFKIVLIYERAPDPNILFHKVTRFVSHQGNYSNGSLELHDFSGRPQVHHGAKLTIQGLHINLCV
jgi:hypothetical protein